MRQSIAAFHQVASNNGNPSALTSRIVPIAFVGQVCSRRGCKRPHWKDGLCNRCWRFAQLFKKDPRMLAYQPLDGYAGGTDAVELPWDEWEKEAHERGSDVVDLLVKKKRP